MRRARAVPTGELNINVTGFYATSPKDPSRHVILVTATPHSGIEESFHLLLGLLDRHPEGEKDRKRLLPHVILAASPRRGEMARQRDTVPGAQI